MPAPTPSLDALVGDPLVGDPLVGDPLVGDPLVGALVSERGVPGRLPEPPKL
jgi:hypothetical protein